MLVLNNTPFVHARVYLLYFKNALPGLKILDIADFTIAINHILNHFCTLLAIKFFAQKNVKLTHDKTFPSYKYLIFYWMLSLNVDVVPWPTQSLLCWRRLVHCIGQLCIARMWLSRPSISMPVTYCYPLGTTKPRQPAKHHFPQCIWFIFLGLTH